MAELPLRFLSEAEQAIDQICMPMRLMSLDFQPISEHAEVITAVKAIGDTLDSRAKSRGSRTFPFEDYRLTILWPSTMENWLMKSQARLA